MAVTTFAAIDIGSYEVSMKIFELSKKNGLKELNHVRYRLEIGKGAYSSGRLDRKLEVTMTFLPVPPVRFVKW